MKASAKLWQRVWAEGSGMALVRAGKGGKEREVPMNAGARRAAAQYRDISGLGSQPQFGEPRAT